MLLLVGWVLHTVVVTAAAADLIDTSSTRVLAPAPVVDVPDDNPRLTTHASEVVDAKAAAAALTTSANTSARQRKLVGSYNPIKECWDSLNAYNDSFTDRVGICNQAFYEFGLVDNAVGFWFHDDPTVKETVLYTTGRLSPETSSSTEFHGVDGSFKMSFRDGKLVVVVDSDGKVVWSVGCNASRLEFDQQTNNVQLLGDKGEIRWVLDTNGIEHNFGCGNDDGGDDAYAQTKASDVK